MRAVKLPWENYIEKRRARSVRHETMAKLVKDLRLISREARFIQNGHTDHMAHVMLDAANVFAEELSAVGKTDLLETPSVVNEPNLPI